MERRALIRGTAGVVLLLCACSGGGSPPPGAAESNQTSAETTAAVGLADVTVLFPLRAEQVGHLLRADESISGRPLLPAAIVSEMRPLASGSSNAALYASLRVVCVRFDPDGGAAGGGQIRFVLQPITTSASGAGAQDAAIHTFYDLPGPSPEPFARDVAGLRSGRAPRDPLGVSKPLEDEGLDGSYAGRLRALIERHTGAGRLSRVTFMSSPQKGNTWQFGGFDFDAEGAARPMRIPTVEAELQSVVLNRGARTFALQLSPGRSSRDDLGVLLDPLRALGAPRADVEQAFTSALRIENPRLRTTSEVDCASCHVANNVRAFAERELGLSSGDREERFADPSFDLTPAAAPAEPAVLRACGYFGDRPVVSTRTIHESAVAARRVAELATPRR